jgi:hypothetical protein
VRLLTAFAISQALTSTLAANSLTVSGYEILARLESENNKARVLLKQYSGSPIRDKEPAVLPTVRGGRAHPFPSGAYCQLGLAWSEVSGARFEVGG